MIETIYSNDGYSYRYAQYVDINGKEVKRNRDEYRYSYDPYVQYRNGKNSEINDVVYSDRLFQWNSEKYNELCMKHFGDEGQYFSSRNPKSIESFLKDYFGFDLKLIVIQEGCNVSNGYSYWIFHFKKL